MAPRRVVGGRTVTDAGHGLTAAAQTRLKPSVTETVCPSSRVPRILRGTGSSVRPDWLRQTLVRHSTPSTEAITGVRPHPSVAGGASCAGTGAKVQPPLPAPGTTTRRTPLSVSRGNLPSPAGSITAVAGSWICGRSAPGEVAPCMSNRHLRAHPPDLRDAPTRQPVRQVSHASVPVYSAQLAHASNRRMEITPFRNKPFASAQEIPQEQREGGYSGRMCAFSVTLSSLLQRPDRPTRIRCSVQVW